jgi:hypothetical protein
MLAPIDAASSGTHFIDLCWTTFTPFPSFFLCHSDRQKVIVVNQELVPAHPKGGGKIR